MKAIMVVNVNFNYNCTYKWFIQTIYNHLALKMKVQQPTVIQQADQLMLQQQNTRFYFLNQRAVVEPYQLLLILCLVFSSLGAVALETQSTHIHIKRLSDYFNNNILGNTWRGLYDIGQNIDQPFTQLLMLSDMSDHFDTLVEFIHNFTEFDSFPQFRSAPDEIIQFRVEFTNETFFQDFFSLQEFQYYFQQLDLRQFLLSAHGMRIKILFGQNDLLSNLTLISSYIVHSQSMLQIDFNIEYKENYEYADNRTAFVMRILQQVFSLVLLFSYIAKIRKLNQKKIMLKLSKKKDESKKKHNENSGYQINKTDSDNSASDKQISQTEQTKQINSRLYWSYSLILLNIVTLLSATLAPLSSLLQILPIFQHSQSLDEKKQNAYNFNVNLRYAIPFVLKVLLPVYIFLNGFILYSLLNYPGQYFDDYLKGFFSYIYNNFQVGTYEIFIQLNAHGEFAIVLYIILYFYMVLVANNLLTALFCTIIQRTIMQQDIKKFIKDKVAESKCPHCFQITQNKEKYQQEQNYNINISSPSLSPYTRKMIKTFGKQKKTINIFIEQTLTYKNRQQQLYFKKLKIDGLVQKCKQIINKTAKQASRTDKIIFLDECNKRIQLTEKKLAESELI